MPCASAARANANSPDKNSSAACMPPGKPSKNVSMLGVVAKGLKGLKEKVVFAVGGPCEAVLCLVP